MAHPYASQAKSSMSRRMKAIGHYAGGGRVFEKKVSPKAMMAKADKKEEHAIPGEKMKTKRYARGGGVKGKKGTQVNVIIAGRGDDQKPQMPMAMPPAPAPMPAPPPPSMAKPPMPMAPPGAMPPGLGPRPFKRGGRVHRYAGGGAADGPISPDDMTDKQKKDANDAMNSMSQSKFKRGGAVKSMKHDDAKEDRAMIKSMVKPSAIKRAAGGKVMMTAGSESGEGRLQKSKMAK